MLDTGELLLERLQIRQMKHHKESLTFGSGVHAARGATRVNRGERHGRKGKARGKGYAWWHVLFEQILVLIVLLLLHWQSLVRHGGSPSKLGVFMEGRLMHWQSLLRWINARWQACLSISFHRFARWRDVWNCIAGYPLVPHGPCGA